MNSGPTMLDRYRLFDEVASGGMASVHLGLQQGEASFSRVVAIKRLLPSYAREPDFVAMFLDEARLAARIRHPNVVGILDVVHRGGEIFLVMDFVHGLSCNEIMTRSGELSAPVPPRVVASIMIGALHGLHAAHEAQTEDGSPLEIVHRDVSPQNILVGGDGIARMLDFGIAKANVRLMATRDGRLKGKLSYMAPEQISNDTVTRLCDVYAAGVVAWEMLTGRRLFKATNEGALIAKVLEGRIQNVSELMPGVPPALGRAVACALSKKPYERFQTARDMAAAIEQSVSPAGPGEVGAFLERIAKDILDERRSAVARVELTVRQNTPNARSVPPPKSSERSQVPLAPGAPAVRVRPAKAGHTGTHTMSSPAVAPPRARAPWFFALSVAVFAIVATTVGARALRARTPVLELRAAIQLPVPPANASAVEEDKPSAVEPVLIEPPISDVAPDPKQRPTFPPATGRLVTPSKAPLLATCDPPYTVDKEGIRRVKPECFAR